MRVAPIVTITIMTHGAGASLVLRGIAPAYSVRLVARPASRTRLGDRYLDPMINFSGGDRPTKYRVLTSIVVLC